MHFRTLSKGVKDMKGKGIDLKLKGGSITYGV